jgi:hypothetical protein
MKLILIAMLVASLQSDTTALVEASKEAKAKKKTSTTKVITNADVKKSKGKLSQRPATTAPDVKPEPTLMEKQAAERTARLATEAKRAELQTTIDALEKEIAALEASYYAANDLDYRDKVIAPKFAEKKAKLDAAKKDLDALTSK